MDDHQKLVVHFVSALLSNNALMRKPNFSGDDSKTESLMYQVVRAGEVCARLIGECGTKQKPLFSGVNMHVNRSSGACVRRRSVPETARRGRPGHSKAERQRVGARCRADQRLRAGKLTAGTPGPLRQISTARITTLTEGRVDHSGSPFDGKVSCRKAARELLCQGRATQAQGGRPRLIGYLIHLYQPWAGLRHVMIVADSELSMLQQFQLGPWCCLPGNDQGSRVVRCFVTPLDWEQFARFDLVSLCCECTSTPSAAS